MRAWIQALRVHQWAKNVLIFVPIVIGQAYSDQGKLVVTLIGFALLCAVASAAYIVNDIVDIEADRAHPTKRGRPFACGALTVSAGIAVAAALIVGALLIAVVLWLPFAIVLAAYLAGTLSYSFYLKRIPLLDVFTIGVLFTERVLMGSVIVSLEQSAWLLSFAMFFFSLALAKRHAEIVAADRRCASAVPGRGYRAGDWPLTLVFGIGSGIASVVIMLLYVANDAALRTIIATSAGRMLRLWRSRGGSCAFGC